jgi:D-sedoheptulose 7-phosphate isomerase
MLENLYKDNPDAKVYAKGYVAYLIKLLNELDQAAVARITQLFVDIHKTKKRIYFAGNGGSASTCGHFVNDFHAGSMRHGGGGFRMVDLTSNVAALTAVANDMGYEEVFCKQLEGVIEAGDVLVVISASGNSPNLIKAVDYAKSHGATTVGLLGFDGGKLKSLCEISLIVATPQGQYGPVEDIHLIINHLISTYFTFAKKNGHL